MADDGGVGSGGGAGGPAGNPPPAAAGPGDVAGGRAGSPPLGSAPTSPRSGWRRSAPVLVALAAVISIAAVVAVVVATRRHGSQPAPVARAYLAAWSKQDYGAMARLVDRPPADFAAVHQQAGRDLKLLGEEYRPGPVVRHGTTADSDYTGDVLLDGLGEWSRTGNLHLQLIAGHWLVEWRSSTIHPSLGPGDRFSVERAWPTRAAILGAGGVTIAGPADFVTVGLQGSAITDPTALTAALTQAGIDPATIAAALRNAAAHPNQFVSVVDLPDARYQQVKPIIFPAGGTRFQRHTGRRTLTPDLAVHVVGSVGPITAEQLPQFGQPYQPNDVVGQGGIEGLDERQLAGQPGGTIKVLDAKGTLVATAFSLPAKPGSPVHTTLDPRTEQAAEAALNGVSQPAALVAIRASTGEVLAAVSRPTSTAFDRALDGQYPPGSTFKVVTSAALLAKGLTPDSPATCPPTITVDGRTFHNFEGEAALGLTLARAFAVSCNTAFIGLSNSLTAPDLVGAATQFGFGTDPKMGLPAFGGRVPAPNDEVEKVATAIGQARVQASPLLMASVAAAVDSGTVRAPKLVAGAPDDTARTTTLDPGTVAALRTMMAGVVANGTGTAAAVAGGPVFGKTGTAEFGNADPPQTHAWFIGFRGDVAFAVVIEGGGVGGRVAAPIAAKFLKGL